MTSPTYGNFRDITAEIFSQRHVDPILHILVLTYEFDDLQLQNLVCGNDLEADFELRQAQLKVLCDIRPVVIYDARKTKEALKLPQFLELHPWKSKAWSCHHSKAYLIVTTRQVNLVLGSFNLTFTGLFRNREVFEHLKWSIDDAAASNSPNLLREWVGFLTAHCLTRLQESSQSALRNIVHTLNVRLGMLSSRESAAAKHLLTSGYEPPAGEATMVGGQVFIGQNDHATSKEIFGDLKLPFINPAVSRASIESASIFLALVLRYIRAWVHHHHATKIGNTTIRWQLNIGSPSNGLENKRLEDAYRKLAATAWIRSQCHSPNQVADCATGLWQQGQILTELTDLQIRPEFVAQMAGYMQSPQKQKGLHALVDVGGGTLDVVTFIVHKVEEEDTFPFLVPEVHALGTHGLLQNRLGGGAAQAQLNGIDELQPITAPDAFAKSTGLDLAHVNRRDQIFQDEVRQRIRSVFEITKSRRYRLSDAWVSGVRTFFTGGGSHVNLYSKAIHKVTTQGAKELRLMPLPPHPKLDGFAGDVGEYQRISVACGLAQDSFTLGRVVPAKEVEDDIPVVQTTRERPDRDDLYPK